MANILWEYSDHDIRKPIMIPALEQNEESLEYEVTVSHDSNKPITGCGLYLAPFSGDYQGTHTPLKDYERLLWLADNYPGFGLSVRQEYLAVGEIDAYSNIRLIDLARPETEDIFSGQTLRIVSGQESDSEILINSYDPIRKLILLNGSFFNDVTGDNYEIKLDQETFFKSKQGSSFTGFIPVLHRAGVINRFEKISFKIKLRIPKFAISAGTFYFDLRMRYTAL